MRGESKETLLFQSENQPNVKLMEVPLPVSYLSYFDLDGIKVVKSKVSSAAPKLLS